MFASTGAIGIPYWIVRMDFVSPHVGQTSGFSFKLRISKVWNRGDVPFELGGFIWVAQRLCSSVAMTVIATFSDNARRS